MCAVESITNGYPVKLVLLGTAGGITYYPACNRASSSSALVVDNKIYIIDLGQGATYRLNQMFNNLSVINSNGKYNTEVCTSSFLKDVQALFFTHLHQDHIADYPNFLLNGAGTGLPSNLTPDLPKLKVFGPCDRGVLDINNLDNDYKPINNTISIPTTNVPGTQRMTDTILQAFAQACNDLTMDDGYPDYTSLVNVTDIGEPLVKQALDWTATCPTTKSDPVYVDDLVSVTYRYVNHYQDYPAFAYRFDTKYGSSVVFSGDTGADTNGNLESLAYGADILVHEVIDEDWINAKFGQDETNPLKQHMLTAHTPTKKMGQIAQDCNVKTLVLNHIVPGMAPIANLQRAQWIYSDDGSQIIGQYSGNFIIGEDLMQIGLPEGVNISAKKNFY